MNVSGTLTVPNNPINGSVTGSSLFVTSNIQVNIQTLPNVTTISGSQATLTIGATSTINVGTAATRINMNGVMYTYGNVVSLSDSGIKRDLIPISEPLARISKLNGYTYIRTDREKITSKRECGLIAQEVAAVLPEVVEVNTDDKLMSIAYGNMAGLFVEGMKEMMERIKNLEAEVLRLKNLNT